MKSGNIQVEAVPEGLSMAAIAEGKAAVLVATMRPF